MKMASRRIVVSLSVQARFVPLLFSRVMLVASVPSVVCEGKEERKDHESKGPSGGEFVPAHATPILNRKAGEGEGFIEAFSFAVELPEESETSISTPGWLQDRMLRVLIKRVGNGHCEDQVLEYSSFQAPCTWIPEGPW